MTTTATGSRVVRRKKADSTTTTGTSKARSTTTGTAKSRTTKTTTKARPRTSRTAVTANRPSSVPDISVYKSYIDRPWAGGHTTLELYALALANGWNVLNEGPTGCAKTHSVEAFAALIRAHFYAVPNNRSIDVASVIGQWNPDPTGKSVAVWQDGGFTDIFRNGGVILANEFAFMPDGIQAYFYQALGRERQITLLENGGEVIKAHPDTLIVADYNPGYAGVREFGYAVRNRFKVQLEWDYDPEVEAQLIRSDSLRAMAQQLRDEAAKGSYDTPIATNMLMEFEEFATKVSFPFAIDNFVTHFGRDERAAVKLVCDTWKSNIELELDAINNPPTKRGRSKKAATVPDDFDAEWGVHGVDWVYEDEASK